MLRLLGLSRETSSSAAPGRPSITLRLSYGLKQRLVIFLFGMMVIGILWIWPLVLWVSIHSTILLPVLMIYYAFVSWGPGAKAAEDESWPAPLRNWGIWKLMADYFPACLVKTADLDPAGKYIFACYPHGISACGGWINFGTNATGCDKRFPGIDVHCMTLAMNFRCPLLREWCLLHGLRSCSRSACINMLRNPGRAIMLQPGGSSEALYCRPGVYDIILDKRKGFVRIALQTGASLVPVIHFGEVNLFSTWVPKPGSWAARLQWSARKLWSSSQPIFWGKGVFADPGLLPYPRPVTSVTGKPIALPKVPKEDPRFESLVDEYHAAFKAALLQLFVDHVDEYDPGTQMRVVA